MLGKLRALKFKVRDGKNVSQDNVQKNINVHEEYHRALRTKSYADFFTKAQLLTNQPSIFSNHNKFSEILLEPSQETITSILDIDSTLILVQNPELKHLLLTYFDTSALASQICTHLLKSIKQVHSNYYHFVQRSLDIIMGKDSSRNSNVDDEELIVFGLESYVLSENPFSNPNNYDFKSIDEKNSSVLQHLKAMRKKVARKIKCIQYMKKACGICVILICGLVAIAATIIATHALTTIIIAPTIFSFPIMSSLKGKVPSGTSDRIGTIWGSLKRKVQRFRVLRSGLLLGKVRDQLDVAAKGSYILKRDFDTMSRLVTRLHDEIERNREMIRFWLGRRKDQEKLAMEIVKELRKSEGGFRKKLEELEEHVYLCLVTINRARALVVNQMTSSCI